MRITLASLPPPIPGLKCYGEAPDITAVGSVDAIEAACNAIGQQFKTDVIFEQWYKIAIDADKLYFYQKEGVYSLLNKIGIHGGAILADDMGLGKTREAIACAETLRHDELVLIVCPASVRTQWADEIKELTGHHACILGPKNTHSKEWDRADVLREGYIITSWNMMEEALATIKTPRILIGDECHDAIASRYNEWGKAIIEHRRAIKYCLLVTGTPYQSKPASLWMQLHVISNMNFGRAKDFDRRYCNGHDGQWGWVNNGAMNIPELALRLSHYMVRRTKAEVKTQLPPCTTAVRWVEGTTKASNSLHKFSLKKHDNQARMAAVVATLDDKMKHIVSYLKAQETPHVVFTWMKEHCEILAAKLRGAKLKAHAIHGDSKGDRKLLIAAAMKDKAHIVITYGAGGTGLDGLQKYTSYGIVHAINPSPPKLLQMMARLDRTGQTSPVLWTYFAMEDSIDKLVVENVIHRFDHWRRLMGYDKAADAIKDGLRDNLQASEDALIDEVFKNLPAGGYDGGE